jgi:DNA processing protein
MTSDYPPEILDLLALDLAPGLGPRLTAALLERFGTAGAIRHLSAAQFQTVPHIGAKLAQSLVKSFARIDLAPELALLERFQARLLARGTPDYPSALASVEDAPYLLYIRGALQSQDVQAVGVVGSRHCTAYGRRITERLCTDLARAGFTVVSGLARGIDGVAHRAALAAGGRTIAVLAGGLSRIYPPEHDDLAREVLAAGALLSETPMGMSPQAGMFPARNRLISGLSRAIVVVEAGEKSGALITAEHAAEQGRTVFAVPGPVDGEASGGTNALIREGAILCRGADDILEELHGVSALAQAQVAIQSPPLLPFPSGPPPGLNDDQRRIWEFLADGVRTLDELAQHLGLAIPPLSTALMVLEMKKAVRRLPGSRYERC